MSNPITPSTNNLHFIASLRKIPINWKELLIFVISIVFSFFILYPNSPAIRPYLGNDSSVFLYIGEGILNGQIPYRDIWDHKPPLIFFINSLAFLIHSDPVWGIHLVQLIFLSLTNCIIWKYLLRKLKFLYSLVIILAINVQIIALSVTGNLTSFYPILFQFGCSVLLVNMQKKKRPFTNGFIFGILFAGTILIRPTAIGVFIAFTIIIISINVFENIQKWLRYSFGVAIGVLTLVLPFALYFSINRAIPDLIDQVYYFNRYYVQGTQAIEYWDVIITGIQLLFPSLLFLLSLIGIWAILLEIIKRKKIEPLCSVAILAFFLDLLFIAYGGRGKTPYYLSLIPALGLLSIISMEYIQKCITNRIITSLIILIPIIWSGIMYSEILQHSYLLGLRDQNYKGTIVNFVKSHTKPEEKIVVWGTESWVYIHSDRKSLSKFLYVLPLFFPNYAKEDIVNSYFQAVVDAKPEYIISTISGGSITIRFGDNINETTKALGKQLRTEYSEVLEINDWIIYQRNK